MTTNLAQELARLNAENELLREELRLCAEENELLETENNQLETDYEIHTKRIDELEALLVQAEGALELSNRAFSALSKELPKLKADQCEKDPRLATPAHHTGRLAFEAIKFVTGSLTAIRDAGIRRKA